MLTYTELLYAISSRAVVMMLAEQMGYTYAPEYMLLRWEMRELKRLMIGRI